MKVMLFDMIPTPFLYTCFQEFKMAQLKSRMQRLIPFSIGKFCLCTFVLNMKKHGGNSESSWFDDDDWGEIMDPESLCFWSSSFGILKNTREHNIS
jgi:hypothetical protein